MLADGGEGHGQGLGELTDGGGADGQALEHGATGGIGQGLEDGVEDRRC
jgi:hypothetical protein